MWIYALLVPLLFRPTWRLLSLLTLAVIILIGVVGYGTGTPLAAIAFYGGINVVVFVVAGALLVTVRRAFNKRDKVKSAKS
ncbi:MAG TPA: hypothetical protein PLS69_02165 [Terricaulis sp.]|nr:hypothetical protein [Terricaulis sp.]